MRASSTSFKPIYDDNNPSSQPVDQFAPLLSRKLIQARYQFNSRPQTASNAYEKTPKLNRQRPQKSLSFSQENFFDEINPQNNLNDHIRCEECFDAIVSSSFQTPLAQNAENHFTEFFNAQRVHFFHDIPGIHVLYGPTLGLVIPYGSSLVGYCHFSKKIIRLATAENHDSYSPAYDARLCPPESCVMLIPLFLGSGRAACFVEIVRSIPFTDEDELRAEYFQTKFRMYLQWILQPKLPDEAFSDFSHAARYGIFVDKTCNLLTKYFMCKTAELWEYHSNTHELFQLLPGFSEPQFVQESDAGIVAYALTRQISVSVEKCEMHAAFNPKTDIVDQSIFALPIVSQASPITYGIVLRGKTTPSFFTDADEKLLARLAPIILTTLVSSEQIENSHLLVEKSNVQQGKLRALLDVARTLSGQLKIEELIPSIMMKACNLVQADRCSLFMVNDTRDKLITSFQGGLNKAIAIPISAGIVGNCATSGENLNISDAYEDFRFNRSTDIETGYRTKTLLCVPIFDDEGNIKGVTEMINKLNGTFTSEDEEMIEVFNVFCGLSIENAKLYNASIELTMQMKSILEISQSIAHSTEVQKVIENILSDTRKVVGAARALLYMIKGDSIQPVAINEDAEVKGYRETSKKEGETQNTKRDFIKELITGRKAETKSTNSDDTERIVYVKKAIDRKSGIMNNSKDPSLSLICAPIFDSSKKNITGVLLMQWKLKGLSFSKSDLDMLETFSIFIALALDKCDFSQQNA